MEQAAAHATRKHAEAERLRREDERKRLEAQEKARYEARATTPHQKREAKPLQRQNVLDQQHRLVQYAWETYEDRWRAMHEGQFPLPGDSLSLSDIPWPVVGSIRSVNELESGRFEGFLLYDGAATIVQAKVLKQRVRDAVSGFW